MSRTGPPAVRFRRAATAAQRRIAKEVAIVSFPRLARYRLVTA